MANRSLGSRRALELLALLMIGDGVLAAVMPTRYSLLWVGGPRPWRKLMQFFADHPAVTRSAATMEAVAGLWIAQQQIA